MTLATLAGSASATYDPQYYDDPGYATAVTSLGLAYGSYTGATLEAGMNTGGGSASASQAQAIRQALTEARWAGKFLPAARTLGAIGLGVTAFDVGWKIGRSIDTKYLHMYNLTTGEIGMDDTYGTVRDSPNGWEWKFTGGEWRKTVYSEFGATCGPLDVIPSTFWNARGSVRSGSHQLQAVPARCIRLPRVGRRHSWQHNNRDLSHFVLRVVVQWLGRNLLPHCGVGGEHVALPRLEGRRLQDVVERELLVRDVGV